MIAAKDAILEGLSWVRIETLRTATEKAFGYASDLKVKLEHSKAPHFNRSLTARSFRTRCCSARKVGSWIASPGVRTLMAIQIDCSCRKRTSGKR